MATENKDCPAFPIILDTRATPSGRVVTEDYFDGLTKREMMAMAAMQGILSSLTIEEDMSPRELAKCSVADADALLAELERTA